MADNTILNAGTGGDTIATDDVTGIKFQRVKLVNGTLDATDAIPGDAANGLDVDVTREPATAANAAVGLPAVIKIVGGWDGTNVQALAVSAAGVQAVNVNSALPAGANAIGKLAANAGVVIGDVNVKPATSGGLLISRTLSAATTNATSVKASAGQVFGWFLYNANAAVRYLKLYNKASAPTVGTDTPVMTVPIPAGAAANVEFTQGIAFGTGIALALTTGVADTDTAAVALNEIVANVFYA